jgi:integrase
MQVEHIDFPERLLAIPQHKTSGDDESTELPISTTVAAMLKSIIGNRTTGNVLLRKPSLVKFTKELETLFGKRIVAKDMRSTHATLALSLEISDYIVKVLELRSIEADTFYRSYVDVNDGLVRSACETIRKAINDAEIKYQNIIDTPEGVKVTGYGIT